MKTQTKLVILAIAAIFLFNGCRKDLTVPTTDSSLKSVVSTNAMPDSMMMTPEGPMPKSKVHLIENGYHLMVTGGHVLKIETKSGKVTEDFGAFRSSATKTVNFPKSGTNRNLSVPTDSKAPKPSSGWVAWTQFNNTASNPINYFSSTWSVPGNPTTTSDDQLFYIWDGLEPYDVLNNNPANLVIQPVLQWGYNGKFGSNASWSVSNWFVWNGGGAYTSPQLNVPQGTSLTGLITYNGETSGSYQYTSTFTQYPNTSMNVTMGDTYNSGTIPSVPLCNWAYEVLEDRGNNDQSTDYPSQLSVNMTQISLQTGPPGTYTPATLTWTPEIGPTAFFGEHPYVVNNYSNGTGQVDLFFHPAPPVITYSTPDVFTVGTAITALRPTNTGGAATSYSVSPGLPASLALNTTTGVITGTPTTTSAATNYMIAATNAAGTGYFTVNIDIIKNPAPVITYTTPDIFTVGTSVSLAPTNSGGTAASYSISPALPAGLLFNTSTGVISGTPTGSSPQTNYVITGTNAYGSGTFTISIVVNITYPFVVSSGSSSTTIYNLVFNGNTVLSGFLVVANDVNNLNLVYTLNSNSTVVFQAESGYMPVSGTLYGNFAPINGTVVANKTSGLTTITFTGVNLSGAQCQIVIN